MKIDQGFSLLRVWGYVGLAILLFLGTWAWTIQIDRSLGISTYASGWILFGVLAFLVLFSGRKKLPFLPLAPASFWFQLHAVGGFLALFLFWLHVDGMGAKGFYGQVLTVLFYITSLSGVLNKDDFVPMTHFTPSYSDDRTSTS